MPAQALGYSLQYVKMTELLSRPGEDNEVEFEGWDDLSIKTAEGRVTLCQAKSALTGNPLTDRSVALWKSLANWAEAVSRHGLVVEKLDLIYYVSNTLKPGAFAASFNAASTESEAAAAIEAARTVLWGKPPKFPLKAAVAQELAPELVRFFEADPKIQNTVVQCFRLEVAKEDSVHADLETKLQWVDPRRRADVLNHAYGWTKKQVDDLVRAKKPAIIKSGDFNREMVAYIRKFNERAILRSFAPAGPNPQETEQLKLRAFVRQLELISLEYSDQLQAISDYYRAAIDRTELGAAGEIHESSFDELDGKLTRTWKNIIRQTELKSSALQEEQRGELVYRECIQQQHLLENQQPADHFVPGCYHLLADAIKLGWHPKYESLLAATPTAQQSTQT